MKQKTISLLLVLFIGFSFAPDAEAQKSTNKKIWAKSYLGKKAPEIVVEEWIKEPESMEGKFILLDMWATWCPPCRKGIPELNDWQEKYKDQLVIIGISDEPKEKVEAFSLENIQYANGYDTQKRVKDALRVTGIPHVLIINPEGIVVWEGFPKLKGHELTSKVLKDLMNQ